MDIFDSCLNLEPSHTPTNTNTKANDFIEATCNLTESQIEEGYKEGYKDGIVSGKQDGYQVGLKQGFLSGEELGFYRGLVDVWTAVIRVKPDYFSDRAKKGVEQLKELINKYPFMDPEDKSIDDVVSKIRLIFKAVSANLGHKFDYKGYPKISNEEDF